jgi:cytidine deaminase
LAVNQRLEVLASLEAIAKLSDIDVESEDYRRLVNAAEAALNAYSKYSHFSVGALVNLEPRADLPSDMIGFAGCNVENASYPVGTCAERNALAAAQLHVGDPGVEPAQLSLVAFRKGLGRPSTVVPCSPCGACRQAFSEFGSECVVLFVSPSPQGPLIIRKTIGELLPYSFTIDG